MRDKVGIGLRWDAPAFLQPRLEFVFFTPGAPFHGSCCSRPPIRSVSPAPAANSSAQLPPVSAHKATLPAGLRLLRPLCASGAEEAGDGERAPHPILALERVGRSAPASFC